MRAIAVVFAAAVFITSPIGIAHAQTYEACFADCERTYEQQLSRCFQYPGSVESDYCQYFAGLERGQCHASCSLYPTALNDIPDAFVPRVRQAKASATPRFHYAKSRGCGVTRS